MVRIDDILEQIRSIGTMTLREPTHLIVSRRTADGLLVQYQELAEQDFDLLLEHGGTYGKEPDIWDVGDFLGLTMIISPIAGNGFKILEEVTTNS